MQPKKPELFLDLPLDLPEVLQSKLDLESFQHHEYVKIGQVSVILEVEADREERDGIVLLVLSPEPSLVIDVGPIEDSTWALKVYATNVVSKFWIVTLPEVELWPLRFQPSLQLYVNGAVTIGQSRDDLEYVTFHLINFVQYLGDPVKVGRGWARDRLVLQYEGWKITLDYQRALRNWIEEAEHKRSFAVTHVGRIERVDGNKFKPAEASEILEALDSFTSFVRGLWAPPVIKTGYNAAGEAVWQHWRIHRVHRYMYAGRWWHELYTENALLEVFPGFVKLVKDDQVWAEVLPGVLYWYVNSNSRAGGLDGALVLIQAALERLAWTYLVQDRKALTAEGYNSLNAGATFRLMLALCQIPCDIPETMVQLTEFANSYNSAGGPEVLAQLRNRIVHPVSKRGKPRQEALPTEVYLDALQLALGYTELMILYLSGYKGMYMRRESGMGRSPAKVPWSPE